ncbi:hypothetical protein C4588_05535 [Candidatus Parcubacteria bacterium]|nr:MAG: hypothetical protein C4588_05535 [Candidatus Parcubacteria bacterium]
MTLAKRKENEEAIDELQYTQEDIRDEINLLSPDDYCKGPEADEDGSKGEIWVFGKKIQEKLFYIKLKIHRLKNGDELIIISFHPAKEKMNFKFKKGG